MRLSYKTLLLDFFKYGVFGSITRLVNFVLLPIFTRLFSTEEYGIIDLISTFASFSEVLIAFSLQSAIIRFFHDRDLKNHRKEIIGSSLLIILVAGSLVISFTYFFLQDLALFLLQSPVHKKYLMYGALFAFFSATAQPGMAFQRMSGNVYTFSIISLLQSLGYILFSLLFVLKFNYGVEGVFLAKVIANSLYASSSNILIRGNISFPPNFKLIKYLLRYAGPLVPSVMITWLNAQADRIIIVNIIGLSYAGIYGAAAKISVIIMIIISAFRLSWNPIAMKLLYHKERNEIYKEVMNFFLGSLLTVALFLSAISKELLKWITTPEYSGGYIVLPWLLGAFVIHGSGTLAALGASIQKKTEINMLAALIGASLNLFLSIFLVRRYGIVGAAYGSFVAELTFVAILIFFSRKVGIAFNNFKLILSILIYIITSATIILSYNVELLDLFIFRIISMVVGGGVLLIILFKQQTIIKIIKVFQEIIK